MKNIIKVFFLGLVLSCAAYGDVRNFNGFLDEGEVFLTKEIFHEVYGLQKRAPIDGLIKIKKVTLGIAALKKGKKLSNFRLIVFKGEPNQGAILFEKKGSNLSQVFENNLRIEKRDRDHLEISYEDGQYLGLNTSYHKSIFRFFIDRERFVIVRHTNYIAYYGSQSGDEFVDTYFIFPLQNKTYHATFGCFVFERCYPDRTSLLIDDVNLPPLKLRFFLKDMKHFDSFYKNFPELKQ